MSVKNHNKAVETSIVSGLKNAIIVLFAKCVSWVIYWRHSMPIKRQEKMLRYLVKKAKDTDFGKDHFFSEIKGDTFDEFYENFKKNVPVTDYEGFKGYIEKIITGKPNVSWPGMLLHLATTSGTTSGEKRIPISKESIWTHIRCAFYALMFYIARSGNASFMSGKMIFLSGSPELESINGILLGRLSGIVNLYVPAFFKRKQMPSLHVNRIREWKVKIDGIVAETKDEDMRLVSGISPWIQNYFDRLLEVTRKKTVKEVFPNLSVVVHGGVNFDLYEQHMRSTIGGPVDFIETGPASEGFMGVQDSNSEGLFLFLNQGVFYEFIPVGVNENENYLDLNDSSKRIFLKDVKMGVEYAIILTTSAGLFSYLIGDTVKLVSNKPHRFVFTGRTAHFISAFGEHVISRQVEEAVKSAMQATDSNCVEFTVAPYVAPKTGDSSYYEWFIEFSKLPNDMEMFSKVLDDVLCKQNNYYSHNIEGGILQSSQIRVMPKGIFFKHAELCGKVGSQFKPIRLSNNRKMANEINEVSLVYFS
ncbi:MAG: GH3 auxin-responsive promoter family protein [Patescibacteria group bacterium]